MRECATTTHMMQIFQTILADIYNTFSQKYAFLFLSLLMHQNFYSFAKLIHMAYSQRIGILAFLTISTSHCCVVEIHTDTPPERMLLWP